jgi:hypothetical protein
VLTGGAPKDQILWLEVVERQRTAPFWVVPQWAIQRAQELKDGGKIEDVPSVFRTRQERVEGGGEGGDDGDEDDDADDGDDMLDGFYDEGFKRRIEEPEGRFEDKSEAGDEDEEMGGGEGQFRRSKTTKRSSHPAILIQRLSTILIRPPRRR